MDDNLKLIGDYTFTHDAQFLDKVQTMLYLAEFVLIPYVVTNAGVAFQDCVFTDNLERVEDDESAFIVVEYIFEHLDEIREYIENLS